MVLILVSTLLLPVYSADLAAASGIDKEQMQKRQEQERQQQEQMKKMQEQARQQQEQMMEQIKKQNPQAYAQMKAAQETQEQITRIITDFRAGKLTYDTAKVQLQPLITEQLKARAANADIEISQLEKRISQLEKFKTNFSEMVDKLVDVRLGKAQPDPTMIF